ncbi:hypothetical protein [Cellulomonas gelida]|uniref:Uncharacterized protein n=1 Tax=Cellulomonas gelida TaxID=1712 RepID=A0A4Y3KK62_9CELL|nr:hypothetical protein [Cellulomonas gelida]GEA84407.1 hypothetical protein CGE01nite_16580 [Cellulomonas gelida]GGL26447.1 hypothetical protein GCM10009774_16110 [Cellulomonas gelida]
MSTLAERTDLQVLLTADASLYGYEVSDVMLNTFLRFLDVGVTRDQIARALVDHRRESDRRFTPAVVNTWVRRQRAASSARLAYPPPQSLDGDPLREIPWLRTYNEAVEGGATPQAAYVLACRAHGCDPEAAFPDELAKQRAYRVIEQYAADARARLHVSTAPEGPEAA